MTTHHHNAPGHELLLALEGVKGPVTTSALVAAAERSDDPRVSDTLAQLPDRVWETVEQAVAAATSGFSDR